MKRKNASLLGNVLMGLGLVVSIFVGAILWLAGARVGGHEQVCDRYWWVRHYDKRCRRSDNRRHS